MSLHAWLGFVAASAVVLVIPGPTILTATSYAIAYGRRVNVLLVAAIALGDSTAVSLSVFGLGSLLAASSAWFAAVKWAGGVYLLYLGAKLLLAPPTLADGGATPLLPRRRLFVNMYVVTALNPKGVIFYVGFLPQFVDPLGGRPQLWILAATFVVLATINATLYTAGAASVRRILSSPAARRSFHALGGSVLIGAGIWALAARRTP